MNSLVEQGKNIAKLQTALNQNINDFVKKLEGHWNVIKKHSGLHHLYPLRYRVEENGVFYECEYTEDYGCCGEREHFEKELMLTWEQIELTPAEFDAILTKQKEDAKREKKRQKEEEKAEEKRIWEAGERKLLAQLKEKYEKDN